MWGFPISIATGDATGYPSSSRPKRALEGPASRGPRPEPLRPLHAGRSAEAPRPPRSRGPCHEEGVRGPAPAAHRTGPSCRAPRHRRSRRRGGCRACFPECRVRHRTRLRRRQATERNQAPLPTIPSARAARSRRSGALLRAACVKRTITRRERPLNAASVRAGSWRFSQESPLSLPKPRRFALTGSPCYIRPGGGDVQRRCPFLARPSEAR